MTYRQDLINRLIDQIECEINMDYQNLSHSKSELLLQKTRDFRAGLNREYKKDELK